MQKFINGENESEPIKLYVVYRMCLLDDEVSIPLAVFDSAEKAEKSCEEDDYGCAHDERPDFEELILNKRGCKMATKTYYFEGISMWPKLVKPDDYGGVEKYKVNIILDNYNQFQQSGVRVRARDTEDGKMVTFSRPAMGKVMPDGTVIGGGRPRIIDKEGNEWDITKLIGNGSRVIAKVSVYDTRMGKGHRLEGVQVIDHVPYDDNLRAQSEEPAVQTTKKSGVPF